MGMFTFGFTHGRYEGWRLIVRDHDGGPWSMPAGSRVINSCCYMRTAVDIHISDRTQAADGVRHLPLHRHAGYLSVDSGLSRAVRRGE